MAKQALSTLKNWFKTGLKPLQEQFWHWLDSFWHKDDKIPTSSIDGLQTLLDEKVTDAPNNTESYVRKGGDWVPIADGLSGVDYITPNAEAQDTGVIIPGFTVLEEYTEDDFTIKPQTNLSYLTYELTAEGEHSFTFDAIANTPASGSLINLFYLQNMLFTEPGRYIMTFEVKGVGFVSSAISILSYLSGDEWNMEQDSDLETFFSEEYKTLVYAFDDRSSINEFVPTDVSMFLSFPAGDQSIDQDSQILIKNIKLYRVEEAV